MIVKKALIYLCRDVGIFFELIAISYIINYKDVEGGGSTLIYLILTKICPFMITVKAIFVSEIFLSNSPVCVPVGVVVVLGSTFALVTITAKISFMKEGKDAGDFC